MRNRGNLRKQRRVSRGNEIRGNPEIDQSATATDPRFRATWKLVESTSRRREDSGRPGDSPLAKPEGARSEATRKAIRRSRRIRGSGQPGKRIVGDTERQRFGATRIAASRHRRRMRLSRRLEDPSPAKPEVRDEGKPKTFIACVARRREEPGRPGTSHKPATLKECDI